MKINAKSIIIFLIFTFSLSGISSAAEIKTRVWKVNDTGEFTATNGERYTFYPLDIPSKDTTLTTVRPVAQQAYQYIRKLLHGKKVKIVERGRQRRNGLRPAMVYLEDGTLVNEKIIKRGYGAVRKYDVIRAKDRNIFFDWQQQAKAKDLGLWASSWRYGKGTTPGKPYENTSPGNPKKKLIE